MLPWIDGGFGNPSNSLHKYGQEARKAVDWARTQVAQLINAAPEEIIFTSGATEANNLAITGAVRAAENFRGILTSELEHPSVTEPVALLARNGRDVWTVQADNNSRIAPADVGQILSERDINLVSIIAVQGEIGTINAIPEIAKVVHDYGALIHTDAAQAVGKIPVDVRDWDVDFLTIAGHKMYAPKGVGALYRKEGVPLEPILHGAGHENGMRPGTENVPYLVGFGEACRLARSDLEEEAERQIELRNLLWEKLHGTLPEVRLNGPLENRHPGNLHVSFPSVDARNILEKLPGYALSVGSACHSEYPEDNPLIRALDIPPEYARGSVRIGIGRSNTRHQIDNFADDLIAAYRTVLKK